MKRFRQFVSIMLMLALVAAFIPLPTHAAEADVDENVRTAPDAGEYSVIREKAPDVPAEDPANTGTYEGCGLIPEEVYRRIILMQQEYPEGMPWTNEQSYEWNINNIIGYGCAAFAFILSDAAFGYMPSTLIEEDITIDILRPGDILRVDNDSHSVVVLKVFEDHIVLAEGNYNDSIHWGREMTAEEVAETVDYVYTRYQEHVFEDGFCTECGAAYVPDPSEVRAYGQVGDNITWYLYFDGRLEITGEGAMWDFRYEGEYPTFFEYVDYIEEVYICDGITEIGICVFWECQMTYVQIAASVEYVGEGAFGYCSELSDVEFLGSAPDFGQSPFHQISTTVHYPRFDLSWSTWVGDDLGGNVTWVGEGELTWPITGECGDNLTWTLEESGLLTVSGTGDMWSFDGGTPQWDSFDADITEVVVENGVTSIGAFAFYECVNLEKATIGNDVEEIGRSCFYHTILSEVTLGSSLSYIGMAVFRETALQTVEIPESVTGIDERAFRGCAELESIRFLGDAPTIASDTFEQSYFTAYYPAGNPTWTQSMFQDYMGDVSWVPYTPSPAVSMELISPPVQDCYVMGDTLSLTGLAVLVSFEDGTSREYGADHVDWSCPMSALGQQTATVTFMGMSVQFPVYIHANYTTQRLESSRYPESEHPYQNDEYDVQSITEPGAHALVLKFSADSELESGWDYVFILDADGNQVTSLTGSAISGAEVRVPGDTATIVLDTDGSVTRYGYVLEYVDAEVAGHEGERTGAVEATCEEAGYTGDLTCTYCPLVMEEGETIEALGHELAEGACTRPGCDYVDVLKGDVNDDGAVTSDDAIQVLYYTLFGDLYPVNQDCDFNGDGAVSSDDAIHLLYYTLFGESMYPLS